MYELLYMLAEIRQKERLDEETHRRLVEQVTVPHRQYRWYGHLFQNIRWRLQMQLHKPSGTMSDLRDASNGECEKISSDMPRMK